MTARLDIMSKRSSFFAKYTSPFHGIYNIIFFVFIEKQKTVKKKKKKVVYMDIHLVYVMYIL